MRKQDYTKLAGILKAQRSADVTRVGDTQPWAVGAGNARAVQAIAHACADALQVDKAAFLKACGID